MACSFRVPWMERMAFSTLSCSAAVIVTELGKLIPACDSRVLTSNR
ncbi:MAG: hypothetical protein IPG74_11815 [Flavobacteriales bacterium]|nr:hypothetical protein [Flavobacteriales bacterium]